MSQQQGAPQSGGMWEAESLRATTFILPSSDPGDMGAWWKTVVENEPEEVRSRPGAGQSQQVGTFEGKRLALVVQPGRVDWNFLVGLGSSQELPDRVLTIGPFPDALRSFMKLVKRWLDVCPTVTRLAFGAILVRPVVDLKCGYLEISPYLPDVKIDPENSSDFSYQINRPRMSKSGMDTLKINRLTQWSVMQAGLIQIAVGADVRTTVATGPWQCAARLQLDINTAGEASLELPKEKTHSVFEELVNLGREIADYGDIP